MYRTSREMSMNYIEDLLLYHRGLTEEFDGDKLAILRERCRSVDRNQRKQACDTCQYRFICFTEWWL